jgi:class 3 adenylate cyclase/CHASE2 domain-containing sensor protein
VRLNFLKSPICLIAALVVFGVCLLEITGVPALKRLEWMTYDWRVRLAHNHASHSSNDATNLGMVAISDNTIAQINSGHLGYKYGLYWPREVYARCLEELSRQGAKAVAFDVLFAERRTDQPQVQLPDRSTIPSDEYFARQLTDSGNAILAADKGLLPAPLFKTNAWRIGNISADKDLDNVVRRSQAFAEYKDWHWIINQVAGAYSLNLPKTREEPGKITFYRMDTTEKPIVFTTDSQGMIDTTEVVNPVPPEIPKRFLPYKMVRVWSMGIVMAAYQLKLDLDHPEIDLPHHRIVLHGEHGLTRVIPVDDHGYFYIDWSMGLNDPRLKQAPFEDLLAEQVEREAGHPATNQWQDKLVVVGSTATGNDLADVGATALESPTFLVSKHWNVANSVISGRFITPTRLPLNLMLIILIGALSAWITWAPTRPVTGSILMAVAAIVYLAVAVALFIHWRIWLPIVLPLVCAGIMTHLSALTYRVTVEQSEKKRIRSLFSRLVSPEVVNKVLGAKAISLDSLAGERRQITVSFADIRGFTELTDAAQAEGTEFVRRNDLSPELAEDYFDEQARAVMQTVSLYLGTIADCVKKHNGTLDKYIGDCVMAFWGAPLANPRHALAAVRCAMEAQQALFALNLRREEENKRRERENFERLAAGQPLLSRLPVLSMGTGINTGTALAGFMGSDAHIVNYTVFGREVNLASRLEGISGHSRIVIGEGTYFALQRDDPDLAKTCVELPRKPVKGFRELVRMFEVPWKPQAPPAPAPGQPGQACDNTPAVA